MIIIILLANLFWSRLRSTKHCSQVDLDKHPCEQREKLDHGVFLRLFTLHLVNDNYDGRLSYHVFLLLFRSVITT